MAQADTFNPHGLKVPIFEFMVGLLTEFIILPKKYLITHVKSCIIIKNAREN